MSDASDLLALIAAAAVVFGAAIVRGFAGFGFSLIAITGLSLFLPPARIVAAAFLLELAAGARLAPAAWREAHWPSLRPLLWGAAAGTPVGMAALARLPETPMALALGLFVILGALLLIRGFRLRAMPGRRMALAAGAVAGACNGAFGIGGPPVFMLYLSSPAGAAMNRATLISCFLMMDVIALPALFAWGLLDRAALILAATLAPALLAGVVIGARLSASAEPERWRGAILRLALALGLVATVKAALDLAR
jgi:uncharacterized membrane protein YfcA